MKLREELEQKTWDALASSVAHATFLQSWAWGEGQAALGKEVKRFVIEEHGEPRFIAQALKETRKGLAYWFVPGGPVCINQKSTESIEYRVWEEVTELLKKELLRGMAVFLRVEPLLELDTQYPIPDTVSWLSTKSFNPAIRWMLDLRDKTEAKLLEEMEQKTRYNVKLGEKQGVTTRCSIDERDFAIFLSLTQEMAQRNKIVVHSDRYLRETFFAMAKRGMAQLRVAEYAGTVLAASIEVTFGDTVTYLHGASSSLQREVKAPNVLQWQAIQAALKKGADWYDFGGCNPIEKTHPLYKTSLEGVTRFKEGWGGRRVEMVGTFILPRFGWMGRFLVK
ncbi:peptidoglycan bridge formation glycyltransferase FemA/FemB family protein [Patescibacteria group bacterium]|nr:peptidoglycan bridge formation glycyltransferase FemA/FemB family protein [Patescibacteria group bacterium]MBP9710591.1 peptidoglycan bridge formation glycyltransferase FemA/FemB family protein [Patescibacteria group bacterium]